MRVWPALVLLAGCNRIFGITDTGPMPIPDAIDAAYFDAPADEPTDSYVRFGTPSRGPLRRMMIRNTGQDYREIEVDATGASTAIGTYTASDLGVVSLIGVPPNMSPDGLRIVFLSADQDLGTITAYADRS